MSKSRRMQSIAVDWKKAGLTIALVPTMGFLHRGHQTLIEKARAIVGSSGKVVVSIYVNPTQFAPHEDLSRYPRDLKGDCNKCRDSGADLVFAPANGEIYVESALADFCHSTFVVEDRVSGSMEGISRPTHFKGVTTIVAKLFNLVLPDIAIFGQKDYQQAAVIRRMVRDLNFPLELVVAPTVREPDGLAMSSRNKYLTPEERQQAVVLRKALLLARSKVRSKTKGIPASILREQCLRFIEGNSSAKVDYIEFFHPDSLKAVNRVERGTRMALAVFLGKTRLIDNDGL